MDSNSNKGSHVRVRPATLADVPDIVEFQLAMALETEGRELDRDILERGVRAVFQDPSRGRYLLATPQDGGPPLGSLLLTYEWSDWRAGTFWWIQSVFVIESARGQGVFRLLYDSLLAEARETEGVAGLRLYVDRDNLGAQGVYRSIGMQASHYEFFELDFVLGNGNAPVG